MALQKLTVASPKIEAVLWYLLASVEDSLNVKRASVELFEYDHEAEAKKRLLFLAKSQKTSETRNRQLSKVAEMFQELQSKVAAMSAKLRN